MQMTLEDMKHDPDDVYVRRISYEETKPFLLNIHYARRMPCITDAFALVRGGERNRLCNIRCASFLPFMYRYCRKRKQR